MFKLKKVELLGFKSFADRTRLEFGDGTAAVVGPNGCGKSNLSDAISWVLGEQSARVLRGDRMADVIFNGTGTRPPTSMAEVSLTLIDPEVVGPESEAGSLKPEDDGQASASGNGNGHAAPGSRADESRDESVQLKARENGSVEGNAHGSAPSRSARLKHRAGEITVTRRLFRSGESEYLINGELCRLRDIQDLFMGTGLGPETYAIIEQGRIGQILSSKPSDRRAIVEEAAGVSKFKARKRLAEAKLESSRQNLARITDILEEVTKQVNSLKRQASKARRYRELNEELRGRLKIVLTSRLIALQAECQKLREQLAAVQEECAAATRNLDALEREHKTAAAEHEQLQSRLTRVRESLAQGELEQERLRSRTSQAHQQVTALEIRLAEASSEREQLQAQLESLERQVSETAARLEQVKRDFVAAQEAVTGLLEKQSELALRLTEQELRIEVCRGDLLAAVSRGADLRNQLVQAEGMRLSLDRQSARTAAERAALDKEHAQAAAELEALHSEHLRDESALVGLTQSASETAAALDQTRQEESSRRSELESLRQEFSQASTRKQVLEESLARHAYATESVRRLLNGDTPSSGRGFHPLGVLADFVEVTPGYEELVEEFLKRELDGVVVEQHEEARRGIALLESEGAGRSTFFVKNFHSNGHSDARPVAGGVDSRPAGVVACLQELVRFNPRLGLNGDMPLPALANAYVVEDASAAERLAAEYPASHFLTPRGEHYHHRLVSGGKVLSAGPLALRRDFHELERGLAELGPTLQETEAALAGSRTRAARLEEELRGLQAAKADAEKKTALVSEKLRQAGAALERAVQRLDVLRQEEAAAAEEREAIQVRRSSLEAELEAAAQEQVRREREIAQATQSLREIRAQSDKLAQNLGEAQARASALEERAQAVETERRRLISRADEVRTRTARWVEQSNGWHEERQQLKAETTCLEARLSQLQAAHESARGQLHSLEQESQTARARRDQLSPAVEAARVSLEARREKRSGCEVALARADSDLAHHAQQCREELAAEPATLLAQAAPEGTLDGERLQAAETELHELKTRLENLGPVNMMALEELQEAEERFGFLETQRQDLLASIEDTTQAIREIDQVSRRQFLEAFQAINGYFAESFRALFGGGIGQMQLSDEADPESGIDIVAQPPGKRLQNVLLLSGGEKALAALALLIAVFRFTPSPFCVLDEVDAPLDDSNVERFTRMIRHLSRHTQFILITHNKRTMEISEVMYGVTMQEPGVSKLVSVRFDSAEREPVAVAS